MLFNCRIVVMTLALCTMMSCKQDASVIVELDVFSGRPNPKWEFPPDRTSTLLAWIKSQPEIKAEPAVRGLGYRGFILRTGEQSIRVYKGLIAVEDHGVTHSFRDTAGVEAELAVDARQRGYADLVTGAPGAH